MVSLYVDFWSPEKQTSTAAENFLTAEENVVDLVREKVLSVYICSQERNLTLADSV